MKKICLLSIVLGMPLVFSGCLDMTIPTSQTVERHICPAGLVPASPLITECPPDVLCEVLGNGNICVERHVDTSGGAGHNCEAGWITVSDSELKSLCVNSEEEALKTLPVEDECDEDDDDCLEEREDICYLPRYLNDEDEKTPQKYYCKPGQIQGRFCRQIPANENESKCSKIAVLDGQRCTEQQSNPAENTLRIHVIDVGQGDAIWIQTPTGQNVLVDAGDSGGFNTSAGPIIKDYLEFHGFAKGSKFDAVFLSHPHADHFGGMPTVFSADGYKIKHYIDPMSLDTEIKVASSYKSWITQMKKMVEPGNIHMPAEEKFTAGDAFPMDFFGPEVKTQYIVSKENTTNDPENPNINDSSIIFKIEFGGRSMIFTGDAETNQEMAAINAMRNIEKLGDLTTNFLKVCHHGSDTSSSPNFLHALWDSVPLKDRAAFISSGRVDFNKDKLDVTTLPRETTINCLILGTCNNGQPFILDKNLYSTEANDYFKIEDEAYRDDNILIVIRQDGSYYACYSGTN